MCFSVIINVTISTVYALFFNQIKIIYEKKKKSETYKLWIIFILLFSMVIAYIFLSILVYL